ncbi:MAG: hypothetical protein MUP48_02185 [Wolbachia endosymbiont of Homalodisca vitripennis]|nr:hypothetical protein [Wolbachia endosymbiont of Homalodisca vitripennis]MCJ7454251.1 hypothetical protein [Wolbachia endosymbiont of Homalodisca vitripennis]MCJ7476050.1 hypothetical protein [Wolbachia endosymbiont of Homalodisca vitripennis]
MNKAVADDYEGIVDLNNNSDGLGKVESISNIALEEEEEFFDAMEDVSNVEEESDLDLATSEEEESISDLEEVEEFFDSKAAAFSVPLSIFHYKDYNSDFFTSWYNMSSGILKEINRTCPEKKVLNLALSVLMLPYIAFTALGLVVYSRLNSKKQEGVGEDKTKKSETSVPKRLAYGVLAAIAIFVNVAVLVTLVVPATIALATFYLLNRDLSHSLVDALKISMGRYSNKHQDIEVSFHETEVSGPSIAYDMEIKFPPQFKQLLRDLCENENNKWFSVTWDSEHNIVLKLPININLKNGLKPLRNEIKDVLAISIQEFAKAMEELMKLEKKEITYDKLKELLGEFRLKIVSSIDSKLITHLIENAYQVAFIQAIKFQHDRRGEDFLLEDELKNTLVRQELESRGKELPNEKEVIIRDLKEAGAKVPDALDDSEFPVFKAEWERLKEEGKIAKSTIIDVYKEKYREETGTALNSAKKEIENLRKAGHERYHSVRQELEKMSDDKEGNNSINDDLKRKLEDLFKFEYNDQEVEQRLVESVMKKAKVELGLLGILSLIDQFRDLEEEIKGPLNGESLEEASGKVNDFIAKMYLEITKRKTQDLFKSQAKGIENSCKLLEEKEPDLVQRINVHRVKIAECLDQPISLREVIEESEDLNKYLEDERKRKGEKHPSTKLIEKHLQNNQEILKALKQLELEKEGLLINKKTKNDYREELESREKIKFAIIEDDLLKAFKHETFDEEEIKKLLEEEELEYYLAEKCIKTPIIKIKNNIKHFCQDLLSPLVDRLANLIINNVPKDNESGLWRIWNSLKVGFNYNVIGWSATVNKDNSTEGKALSVAHDTHKEVETFLQHFQSSYEGVGGFLGDLFSDNGETFKNNVWPKVEEHLHGMWDRFFKDIEFKIGNKLDEVNVTQQNQRTVITA